MLCYLYIHLDPRFEIHHISQPRIPNFLARIVIMHSKATSLKRSQVHTLHASTVSSFLRPADVRSVVAVRETGSVAAGTAAAAGDGHEAVDAEGDEGEDGKEEDDDDGNDVVFLHLEGVEREGGCVCLGTSSGGERWGGWWTRGMWFGAMERVRLGLQGERGTCLE